MSFSAHRAGSKQSRPGFPGWAISFDYDAELVATLKRSIHASRREWWIMDGEEDKIEQLWPSFASYRYQPELPGMAVEVGLALGQRAQRDIEDLWGPQ